MLRKLFWAALAVLSLAICAPASAQPVQGKFATCDYATPANCVKPNADGSMNMAFGGPYALLTNASASGSAVGPINGGSYEWCTTGTFGGASLQLQALGPDGTTYINVGSAVTSAGCTGVVLGRNAQVKVTVTGGTPSGLFSSLS